MKNCMIVIVAFFLLTSVLSAQRIKDCSKREITTAVDQATLVELYGAAKKGLFEEVMNVANKPKSGLAVKVLGSVRRADEKDQIMSYAIVLRTRSDCLVFTMVRTIE